MRFREGLVNAMVELRNDRSVLHGRITDLRFTIVTGRGSLRVDERDGLLTLQSRRSLNHFVALGCFHDGVM